LKSRHSGLLRALGKQVTLVLYDRSVWPCRAGRLGYRERFPRSNCAQERSGRTDRGPAEPHGAHIPKSGAAGRPSGWRAVGRNGGPLYLRQRCTTLDPIGDATAVVAQPAGESSVSGLFRWLRLARRAKIIDGRSPPPRRRTIPSRLSLKSGADDDVGVLNRPLRECG